MRLTRLHSANVAARRAERHELTEFENSNPTVVVETPEQRATRNWDDLLKELGVMQTGAQLLTGFLLTLPFQTQFSELDTHQRILYLALVAIAVSTIGLVVAPVTLHRMLYHHHRKQTMVIKAQWFLRTAIISLGLLVAGVTSLAFDIVVSRQAGIIAGIAVIIVLIGLWLVFPEVVRQRVAHNRDW